MAMLPFIGYNAGDYFGHWLEMGRKASNPPEIFHVNWFRTDANGDFIWPGFGDNFRVLEWIINRCENKVGAEEAPIGYIPRVEDINTQGLDIADEALRELLTIDSFSWMEDVKSIEEFYAKIGRIIPAELYDELNKLKYNLSEISKIKEESIA